MNDGDASEEHRLDLTSKLIDLLEFEIGHIQKDATRPGWTLWALSAAIGSIIWLLLNQWANATAALQTGNVLLLVLIISISWRAVSNISVLLSLNSPLSQQPARFWRLDTILSGSRMQIMGEVVWHGVLVWVLGRSPIQPNSWLFWLVGIIFVGNFFIMSGILVMSLSPKPFHFPWPPLPIRGAPFWGGLIRVVYILVCWAGLFTVLMHRRGIVTVSEVRVAGLTVVLAELVLLILAERGEQPFLQTFRELRRKLGLGLLTYEFARRQVEIAFEGMAVTEIFSGQIESILNRCREVILGEEIVLRELTSLQTAEKRSVLETILPSLMSKLRTVEKLGENIVKELARLEKRARGLKLQAPHSSKELDTLVDSIKVAVNQMSDKSKANRKVMQEQLAALRQQ